MELAQSAPESPKRVPFNPTWIAVGILGLTQVMGWGSFGQRATTTEAQVVDLMVWRTAMEKRLAEVDKSSAVSNAKIEKDIESMKTGISDLRSALMGGRAPVAASPTP